MDSPLELEINTDQEMAQGELGHRQYCNRSTWADRFGFGGIISFPSGYAGAWYVA